MQGEPTQTLTAAAVKPTAVPGKAGDSGIGTERILADVLADVMHVENVPVDSHFFDDLGADSLVMAHFCARVRKRDDLPSVSIKDIYRLPTISMLAAELTRTVPDTTPGAPPAAEPAPADAPGPATTKPGGWTSTLRYVLCGAVQFLIFLGYACVLAAVMTWGYQWISDGTVPLLAGPSPMLAGTGATEIYLRAVAFGLLLFVAVCTLPILAKWILVGRWKPGQIRIWSLAYLRFWIVKTLVRSNPLALLFAGSPLYVTYLRLLGARIGRGVAIFSKNVPVCTDLLTIGAGTVIRKDSYFLCYRAHAGMIQMGPVTLGRDVLVGERTVLDIDSTMGDRAQLGHASSLHGDMAVPDGERWHGSPAQRTGVNYLRVAPARCGALRRLSYTALGLLAMILLYLPLAEGVLYVLLVHVPAFANVIGPTAEHVTGLRLYVDALLLSLGAYFGFLIVGLLFVLVVPRLLYLFLRPDRVYPLYGFHYGLHRAIARITNAKAYLQLFGDSSYIVDYLRRLGYDLSRVVQTGSNFGTAVAHETPYLSSIGSGTMVADGLSIMNADYSNTSFQLSRVTIGPRNFLGNAIAYPPGGRTGDNCLLATKVMVPLDGEIRHGTGLLGSPPFEIPRSMERDSRFDDLRTGDELRTRLAAKNRYNLRTMGIYLFVRWLHLFLLTALGLIAADLYGPFGYLAPAAFAVLSLLVSAAYTVLAERGIARFRSLRPRYCSIYDPYFWWHERYWKLVAGARLITMLGGTPFKNVMSRLLGVRIGKRVFDDGCGMTERTLVTIGDDCTLNVGSTIQGHSQEDGTFKSDRSEVGAGATLGVAALIHYGVHVGDGSTLDADAFLMKGEHVMPYTRWRGNPATEMRPAAPRPRRAPPERPLPSVRPAAQVPAPASPGPDCVAVPAEPDELARTVRPRVRGELPGPRSTRRLAGARLRRRRTGEESRRQIVVAEASGSFVRDLDGNVFIDFLAGNGAAPLGHNLPELTAPGPSRGVNGLTATTSAESAFGAAQLSMLPAPMRYRMCIHVGASTGARAVQEALELCQRATGRRDVVSFYGGFFPVTRAITAVQAHTGPPVRLVPFCSCTRFRRQREPRNCRSECASFLQRALVSGNGPGRLPAAVLISLVQGEGGVLPARRDFVQQARAWTRQMGIPLVVDEVQTGGGRTGTWFAFEQYDIEPDVVVGSKGLVGIDHPVAVTFNDARLERDAHPAAGGPADEAALLAGARLVDIVRRDQLLRNVRARAEQIGDRLVGLGTHPAVLSVRGLGLMWGIELAAPGDGRTAPEFATDVHARALHAGLILRLGGTTRSVLRLQPPLNLTAEVADVACSILLQALEGAFLTPTAAGPPAPDIRVWPGGKRPRPRHRPRTQRVAAGRQVSGGQP